MPGTWEHTPEDVVATLLVNIGQATDPTYWANPTPGDPDRASHDWPAFPAKMPDTPDNCIAVIRGADRPDVRVLVTGENVRHFGITIRVRGATNRKSGVKQLQLEAAITQGHGWTVTLQTEAGDDKQYFVQSFPQVTALPGYDEQGSKRRLHNLNCLAVIIPYPIQG
jgi:hypothetical protein